MPTRACPRVTLLRHGRPRECAQRIDRQPEQGAPAPQGRRSRRQHLKRALAFRPQSPPRPATPTHQRNALIYYALYAAIFCESVTTPILRIRDFGMRPASCPRGLPLSGVSPAKLHQRSLDDARPCAVVESAEAPTFDRGRCARPFLIEGGARRRPCECGLASSVKGFPVSLSAGADGAHRLQWRSPTARETPP